MSKITDGLKAATAAIQHGEELANWRAWKRGQIAASSVAAFLGTLVALLRAFGIEVPLTDGDIALAGGLLVTLAGALNAYATAATSPRIGPNAAPPAPDDSDSAGA